MLTSGVLQVGFLTTFAILLHEIPHEVRWSNPHHQLSPPGTFWCFKCVFWVAVDCVLVFRWETLPSYSGLDLTGGAPLACSCPRRRLGFSERVLRSVLSHRRAQVRRACPYMWITELPLQLTAAVSPHLCRKCHRLDTTLHRWRLPLHSSGECGARPAGGVQFKVSVYVQSGFLPPFLLKLHASLLPCRDQWSLQQWC